MSWRKYRKVQNFLNSNRSRNKNDKDGNEDITTVSYKMKFINSGRFMGSS